jgi:TonB family protein
MRGGVGDMLQEWYDPDSVDAGVAQVRALNREGAELPKDVELRVDRSASLGSAQGIRFTAGFFRHGRALDPRSNIWACGGAFNEGEQPVGDAATFLDAARDARARRSPPLDPNAVVHSANDVACPAWLPWRRTARQGFERVWQYPVGPYPASMRATNARADVLVSFVVDTSGAPELASVRVMKPSDPRAGKALSAALRTLRFRPATRSGVKVRQRVIQPIRFEPLPICATPRSGPVCPRRYSQ